MAALQDEDAALQAGKALVRIVVRAFYTDDEIAMIECLMRNTFLRDPEDLEPVTQLHPKIARSILEKLHQHYMIMKEEISEKKEREEPNDIHGKPKREKLLNKIYWYIDYEYFRDMVSLRLFKMSEYLKKHEKLVGSTSAKTMFCPKCKKEFDQSQVNLYMKVGEWIPKCPEDKNKLVPIEGAKEKALATQVTSGKLKVQLGRDLACKRESIMELVQAADKFMLPSYRPSEMLEKERLDMMKGARKIMNAPGDGSLVTKDGTGKTTVISFDSELEEKESKRMKLLSHTENVTVSKAQTVIKDLPFYLKTSAVTGQASATGMMPEHGSSNKKVNAFGNTKEEEMARKRIEEEDLKKKQAAYAAEYLRQQNLKKSEKREETVWEKARKEREVVNVKTEPGVKVKIEAEMYNNNNYKNINNNIKNVKKEIKEDDDEGWGEAEVFETFVHNKNEGKKNIKFAIKGVLKDVSLITELDEDEMTANEYEAYSTYIRNLL